MAWDHAEGALLVVDATTDQLYSYDTATQTASMPLAINADVTDPGLTTIESTGETYLCSTDSFYELDTMFGPAGFIGLTMMAGPCTVLAAPPGPLDCG